MSHLDIRIVSRAGDPERTEAAASSLTSAPLFERPSRSRLEAPPLSAPASSVLVQFPTAGARFGLHEVVLRGEDGADLFRWMGSGDLFRRSRDLRAVRNGKAVTVECLSDASELEIELDPRLS